MRRHGYTEQEVRAMHLKQLKIVTSVLLPSFKWPGDGNAVVATRRRHRKIKS